MPKTIRQKQKASLIPWLYVLQQAQLLQKISKRGLHFSPSAQKLSKYAHEAFKNKLNICRSNHKQSKALKKLSTRPLLSIFQESDSGFLYKNSAI